MTEEEVVRESDELYEHFRFTVDAKQSLIRIDKFLQNHIQNSSRTKIQAASSAGNIIVNDKPVKQSYKIKPGDHIAVVLHYPPRDSEVLPENIPLDILFEDDDLLVVNKPAGMVVHPAYGNFTGTLVNALTYHLKDLPLFSKGEIRPGLVHRIDKNTSGILVVGKNEIALNKLSKQFYDRESDRKYLALVWGDFKENAGTITGHIGRSAKDRRRMDVFEDGSFGKHAITHYRVLERYGYVSLVECKLETGRTHQIRVHFQHINHPVFNDEDYGGNVILRGTSSSSYKQFVMNCFEIMPRQGLHAKSLGFKHPTTGKWMEFDSELPADMKEVLDRWKRLTANKYDT
jgi:23S rRNA pseudouridine1911/1915/1917 synthase